jgi:hypothetical protein
MENFQKIIRGERVNVFKDILVKVIIFIVAYFTNQQHYVTHLNIHFNKKKQCPVFPPPAKPI